MQSAYFTANRGAKSARISLFKFAANGDKTMSMADRDGFIWHDGKLVPWREATTHVLTHTLHYGMGVFEGIRAYQADKGCAIFLSLIHISEPTRPY